MNQVKVIIKILDNKTIAFRFKHIPYVKLVGYVSLFKRHFSNMRWMPCEKHWILDIGQLKYLYEDFRCLFDLSEIDIVSEYCNRQSSVKQLSIFDQ